ncbi:MAG: CrcB family protein [Micrococcaceae bacterium]
MTTLLIGIFGSLGAFTRYLIDLIVTNRFKTKMPWAILGINIVGSAIFTLATKLISDYNILTPITIGFCGGFTTFSTVIVSFMLSDHVKLRIRLAFLSLNIALSIAVALMVQAI